MSDPAMSDPMSDRRVVVAPGAPKPHAPSYAHAVRSGQFIFCTGQMGETLEGKVEGDAYEQAKQALANLDAVLRSEGASLDDAVKLTVFLVDWSRDYPGIARALDERLAAVQPARSTVEVRNLAMGALVEIEAIATAPDRH
jgi:2-iminobutanoate/2-iminopropanoate deaminase